MTGMSHFSKMEHNWKKKPTPNVTSVSKNRAALKTIHCLNGS